MTAGAGREGKGYRTVKPWKDVLQRTGLHGRGGWRGKSEIYGAGY